MSLTFQQKLESVIATSELIPGVIIIQNLSDLKIEYMSPRGLNILGVDLEEIKSIENAEYNDRYFNVEDWKDYSSKILELIESKNENDLISFFQQVRKSKNHEWTWYLSTLKIFHSDENDIPTHVIVIACPIDSQNSVNAKVDRLLDENTFLRNNHKLFSSLTNREIEILKLMAIGQQSADIAEMLHISEKTISTHRKNIRNKLQIQNQYELTKFAQAFNLI
ncbi:MAG: helix-turn-helix transcriptional regulator [Sporocytophaga sp.]|uniref:response regulator transcription factor n=1 Tax=Sporocytophaga sp. TaxID=2231183 RepID=UPI001B0C23BA|nr:helix-turn-helix transcriptional regulator [Sporocytophaga sp.]MBO9702570.1 helix-turn-helix transcriptional regulator [Sporocytophaga sp.]